MTPDAYWLRDLGSLNRTFVNNQPIQECQVYDGDRLRFGRAECQFCLTLPTSVSPPQEALSEGWSIVNQLSPKSSETALQALLLHDQPTEKIAGTILNLRPQTPSHRAEDKLKILLALSREFSTPQEIETLLEKILDLLFQIMNVDRGVILLNKGDAALLKPAAVKFRAGIEEDPSFFSKTIVRYVQDHGDVIVTADALNDQRFQQSESILQQVIHASMCVPLNPRDGIIGLIYVDNLSLTNVYSHEDLEFLTSLANQAAIAIENAQLYQKIQAEAVMRSKLERFSPTLSAKNYRKKKPVYGTLLTQKSPFYLPTSAVTPPSLPNDRLGKSSPFSTNTSRSWSKKLFFPSKVPWKNMWGMLCWPVGALPTPSPMTPKRPFKRRSPCKKLS